MRALLPHLDVGTYRFYALMDDRFCLHVDDRLLLDLWANLSASRAQVNCTLDDGRYRIEVQYYQQNGGARY